MAKKDDKQEQPESEKKHFAGVLVEDFHHRVEIVLEGMRGFEERLDRFEVEFSKQMNQLDFRIMRLEALLWKERH